MVATSGVPITVGRPGDTMVNGASVLAVMALGIKCGERIVISTEQPGAESLLNDLVKFVETDQPNVGQSLAPTPPASTRVP